MKHIKIEATDLTAIVDDCDYPLLSRLKWYSVPSRNGGVYAMTRLGGTSIFMHRLVIGITGNTQEVDHINGNRLDNRQENLRKCSRSFNVFKQRRAAIHSAKCRGVSQRRGAWRARITVEGKSIELGTFRELSEAIEARHEAELRHYGEHPLTT